MMNIQVLQQDRMSESGRSLLSLMQAQTLCTLDLLVREAIQNSLDASKDRRPKTKVDVDFVTGSFDRKVLNSKFEFISDKLNARYPSDSYKFIAIRDSGTVGLEGSNHHSDVRSRLQGLVYQISKKQEAEGSGGSWGLGKTTFFRVGIGLVIYYSKTFEKGAYVSKLAATLVEDELENSPLINLEDSRGISFFGRHESSGKVGLRDVTVPITDESYIADFLSILGLKPYESEETGTTVIMPYTDYRRLLQDAKPLSDLSESVRDPPWTLSIEEYFNIAIQRWYAPRLHNTDYEGSWLKASINGQVISRDKMHPLFRLIQELYNKSSEPNYSSDFIDRFDVKSDIIGCQSVIGQTAGYIASAYVGITADLRLTNEANRDVYAYVGEYDAAPGTPIVAFTRKPGMLVRYAVGAPWSPNIPGLDENKVLICVFKLASDKILNGTNLKDRSLNGMLLEEYMRQRERADHHDWENNPRYNIVQRIAGNTARSLKKTYQFEPGLKYEKKSRLSEIFASFFLPKIGAGTSNTVKERNLSSGQETSGLTRKKVKRSSKTKFEIISNSLSEKTRTVEFILYQGASFNRTNFEIVVFTERGSLNQNEWENDSRGFGRAFPISLDGFVIEGVQKPTGDYIERCDQVNTASKIDTFPDYTISVLKSSKGIRYGVSVATNKLGLVYKGRMMISSKIDTVSFNIICSSGKD